MGGENDWRWMLGVVAIPSLFFSLLMLITPETPRWLVLFKKDDAAATKVLALTGEDAPKVIADIKASVGKTVTESLFNKKFFKPLLLAFLIAFFNQLSGINAIIYFAPKVFEMAGIGREGALLSTVVIWVFLSELFPNSVRASGTSFGSLVHWVFAAFIAQVFPYFAANISGTIIFGFFAFMMVLQLLYVWRMMPETKGVALEDMGGTVVLH